MVAGMAAKKHFDSQIVLRLAAPLRAQLEAEAGAAGVTLGEHVRQVLIDHAAPRISGAPAQRGAEAHR
jgi:hypothetical protein